jgi:5-(carboxyamino)imidazole ribonucleotide mutase
MDKVLILMGSDSDWPIIKKSCSVLNDFNVSYNVSVSSAHRTPEKTTEIVSNFKGDCIIVGAGAAAHLAGVVAAHTIKPVIAIPIDATSLKGVDALYSTVQMPSGIPVASMAIDGSKNAALFAIQILSLSDDILKQKLIEYKQNMVKSVNDKDNKIKQLVKEL